METLKTETPDRATFGSQIRKALSCAVLPCLVTGLLLGCSGSTKKVPVPVIDGFSPSQGAAGSQVVLTGTSLSNTTVVAIGGVRVSQWTTNSDTQVTLTVPATAITGQITVNDRYYLISSAQTFTVVPQIIALTPLSGPVGTPLVLTGSGLNGTSKVTVGTETPGGPGATFTVENPNQVNIYVPNDATTGPVQLVIDGVTYVGPTFTVTQP